MVKLGEVVLKEDVKAEFIELNKKEQAMTEIIQRTLDSVMRGQIPAQREIQADRNKLIEKVNPEIKKVLGDKVDLGKVKINFLLDQNKIDILDENGYNAVEAAAPIPQPKHTVPTTK
jgi:hypothetical protein